MRNKQCFMCDEGVYIAGYETLTAPDGRRLHKVPFLMCSKCGDKIYSYEASCKIDEFLGIKNWMN